IYYMKVLKSLADPKARAAWQAKPTTDPICDKGPWLKPQLESLPTSIDAKLVSIRSAGDEANVVITVKNTGKVPAYPAKISVAPDVYSSMWSDNYFWLAPGETRQITGVIKLNMKGLDPIANPPVLAISDMSLSISAWNAQPVCLRKNAVRK
ncbi:MAG: glycoside hydrolase family 2 protein, partial [Armatimonadota bacterium]